MPPADGRTPLCLSDRVVRSHTVLLGEVNGEIVALDAERGLCFALNAVGSDIWRRIDSEVLVRDLCRELCESYDIGDAQCEMEVIDLLEDLRSEGLIEIR